MITFDQFLAKYNNQPVEAVDPSNLNQCFDLVVQYCEDVLGLPVTIFSGLMYAKQIWTPSTTLAVQKFDYVDNTPTAVPQKGDIVVWSGWYNWTWLGPGAGHTGIATGLGDINSFQCFEQNDPTGTYSHLRWYNYNSVLGWLRFKQTTYPHEDLARQAAQTAFNEIVTASQQGDPNFKVNMADVKAKLQEATGYL